MAAKDLDPGEIIELGSSSDAEPEPSKKRTLGETEESSISAKEASLPNSKRPRTDSPDGAIKKQEIEVLSITGSEEGEIDETQQPASTDTGPTEDPIFQQDSISFRLPHLAERTDGSWFTRFKDWVQAFLDNNSEHVHAIRHGVVQAAYACYIDQHSGLKLKKRRSAKQAAQEVKDIGDLQALLKSILPEGVQFQTETQPPDSRRRGEDSKSSSIHEDETKVGDDQDSDSEVEYEPLLSKSEQAVEAVPSAGERVTPPNGSAANGVAMNLKEAPSGNEALEQQRKYFPSAADSTNMCLLCGGEGHLPPSCPTRACQICGSGEHLDLFCPTRLRCEKCRQTGHRKAQCTEKLALTKDEGLSCDICHSPSHLEKDCTDVWRSFCPDTQSIHHVMFIPASCAACGSDNHFSTDCGGGRGYHNPTWSMKNRDHYVDANCKAVAIEQDLNASGAGHTSKRAPDLKIRGHAARTTNVHYSESDDSEVEFLGKRAIKQKAPVGQIRVASNIQMPQQGASRNSRMQPPLPPGPPPSGPPPRQGSYGYPPPGVSSHSAQSRPPPPSLPAKPPASNRDYRNVPPPPQMQGSRERVGQNRQPQHGGRGGRGGRGGGRGRGRGRGN